MSIDRTQAVNPVSTVQPRETHDAGTSKLRPSETVKTSEAGTQVKLSDAQSQLMKPGSEDINIARVEQLKTAIRNGELKMDSSKIADALIQQTKDDLQRK